MFDFAVRSALNLAVFVAVTLCGIVAAMSQQSQLPPCLNSKSGTTVRWHNCQGTHALRDKFKSEYVGEWRGGKPNGQGSIVGNAPLLDKPLDKPRPDGKKFKYVGEFRDGKMHGQGTITGFPDTKDVFYVGEFRNGKFHGQGTFTESWTGKYVGEFQNNKFHGQGTWTYPGWLGSRGFTYVGEFRNNKFHGQGTITYLSTGWSTKHLEGEKYVGEFRNKKFHGQGILYAPDGSIKQAGIWANDKFVKKATVDPAPK